MSGRDDKPGKSGSADAGIPDDELLTSEDLFGELLDSPPPPRTAHPPTPPAARVAPAPRPRAGPIKVQVSEPGVPKKAASPLAGAAEAMPEDVAALLDAFSEPGEAATRAEALEAEALATEPKPPRGRPAPPNAARIPEPPEIELPPVAPPVGAPRELRLDELVSEPPPSGALDREGLLGRIPPPPPPTAGAVGPPALLDPTSLVESIDAGVNEAAPARPAAPEPARASQPEIDLSFEEELAAPPPQAPSAPRVSAVAPTVPGDALLEDMVREAPPAASPAAPPAPRRPSAQESLQELMDLQRPRRRTGEPEAPPATSRTGTRFQASSPKKDTGPNIDLAALAAEALGGPPPRPRPADKKPSASLAGDVTYGPYRLLEKVAVGGMAEVFRAKRSGVEGFEKVVAVKRILSHLSDNKEFVDMFIDEAKMVAGLAHPNIVQIFDLGKIEKSYYIAMEYVRGRDLRTILRRGRDRNLRVPLDLTTFVVSRVCSALEYAHRAKDETGRPMMIVHRDISPQNILISFEGDVKLTDFGIAKAATKASITDRGALRGKLLYMSPEQAWGKPIDRRSDIFSLGIVFYEMLTDQKPFLGNSEMSILEMVRECKVAPPSSLNPRIPEKLERVVMKSLERDPEVRYQDGAEMHRDLERVLHERQPPTAAGLARFLELLFEQDERGDPVPHPDATYEEPTGSRPIEMEFHDEPRTPVAGPDAEGSPDSPKDPMSIQKLLKRFGIK
jgi:tRNA A-37 threonylcarbamoyl transferase component Bud32